MTLICKFFVAQLVMVKAALLTAALSIPTLAVAKEVELMDGVLEKAVVGFAQIFVVLAGVVVYWLVFYPIKHWLTNKKLAHSIEKQKLTALMLAAAEGDDAEVEKLLKQGSDVNEAGKSGETALMLAAKNDKRSTVRLLLANGANSNATTAKGNTARDIAKKQGHGYIVDILDDAGETFELKSLS